MNKILWIIFSTVTVTAGIVWGAAVYVNSQQNTNKDYSKQFEEINQSIKLLNNTLIGVSVVVDSVSSTGKSNAKITIKNSKAIEVLNNKVLTKDELIEYYKDGSGFYEKKNNQSNLVGGVQNYSTALNRSKDTLLTEIR